MYSCRMGCLIGAVDHSQRFKCSTSDYRNELKVIKFCSQNDMAGLVGVIDTLFTLHLWLQVPF